jgi:NADH dehydrogenase FAD-containing subunit
MTLVTAHFVTSHNEQKTKAIKCGAFNYSIVVNAHRVTSMADTDIDAVRKQKKAEYDKQYRLQRKLLLQQQASKDIYMIGYFHP